MGLGWSRAARQSTCLNSRLRSSRSWAGAVVVTGLEWWHLQGKLKLPIMEEDICAPQKSRCRLGGVAVTALCPQCRLLSDLLGFALFNPTVAIRHKGSF